MPTHAPCLGPPLDAWLSRLDKEGFRVGIRERLLVQTLFAGLAAAGDLDETSSLEEMLKLAGPLVCSQPEQQRKYASLLSDFVREIRDDKANVSYEGTRPSSKARKSGLWHSTFAEIFAFTIGFKLWWLITLPCPPSSIVFIPPAAAPTPQIVSPTGSVSEPSITDAKTPIPNPQTLIAISENTLPAPAPPVWQPWRETSRIVLLIVGGTIITSLAWLTWAGWRRKHSLQGVRTDEQVEEHFFTDPDPIKIEPSPELVRLASRTLRQRYTGDHLLLDIPATLRATMLAGNALALRYRSTTLTPEYLALIDQRHADDHLTACSEALVNALKRNGVALQTQYFEGSPQTGCWRVRQGLRGLERVGLTSFSDIASRFTGHRLLIFAETQALLDETEAVPRGWAKHLAAFPQRAWFTPMPLVSWGQSEQAADAQGFLVLPVQPESLHTMANWFSAGQLGLEVGADWPLNFPPMLRGDELEWVVRLTPPPAARREELFIQLRNYLGAQRFQWLCACANVPAITPAITMAMGRELTANARELALGAAAIGALPWFRHAFMPAWLRLSLSSCLKESDKLRFQKVLSERLDKALEGTSGSRLLTLAERKRRLSAWLRRRRGPARDVVLVDLLQRGPLSALAHKLPESLRRCIFTQGLPVYGMTTGILWAFHVGLMVLAGILYYWPVDSPTGAPQSRNVLESINNSLSDSDLQQWYHLSAGTQLIPYDWFVALLDESLTKTFAVTGLVEDPNHTDKLPVGFAKTEGPNVPIPQVGFTCSFCHTTQFRYKGQSIRIEGGPSLQNNATFGGALVQRLAALTPPDAYTFLKSLKEESPPEPFKTFATRVLSNRGEPLTSHTLTKLAQDVTLLTQALVSRSGRDTSPQQWGPGRIDALGRGGNLVFARLNPDNFRPANAPVSIPPLWGVWEFDWVQWAGSIQPSLVRDVAEVIGVNAGLFNWARPGIPIPADKTKLFHSSIDITSLTTLENLARRLPPPQWPSVFPAINRELATRGKDLYHGNKIRGVPNLCAHCHVPAKIPNSSGNGPSLQITMVPSQEIGTDSLYLDNFSQRTMDTSFLGRGRISAREASEYVTSELMAINNTGNERPNTWRDKAQYIARPHLGVWATAPYLHNGSIPTLYELLSPARERRACFVLDPNMEFDPEKMGFVTPDCSGPAQSPTQPPRLEFQTAWPGNSNRGHEFANTPNCDSATSNGILGCELPVDDRLAIIEYLKTCDLDRLILPNAPVCRNFD